MNHTMISVLSIDDDPEIYEILQLYLAGIAEVEYAPKPSACLAKTVGKDVLLEKIHQVLMEEEA